LIGLAILLGLWPGAAAAQITITAPPALAATAARIDRIDQQALRQALVRAGLSLPSPIHVTVVADDDPRVDSIPRWVAGLARGRHDILIFPERIGSYPYDSLDSVVRHEVAHLALTARADGQPLPRWFHEGVAVSVDAGWDLSARVQLLVAMLARPDIARLTRLFTSNAEPETRQAYLLAAVLVNDVRQRHGADTPGAIAARVASGVPFVRAFQQETGETPDAAAARAWASYRRWTAWVPAVTSASAAWTLILALAFVAYFVQMRRRARRRRQWDDDDW
jgi:hypothetical protein